ncbi:MAG: Maf family protein [Ruminococcus sp.]|nr:Maf family protein [Ruminococcus sp.]
MIILASASPRRRELLSYSVKSFEVRPTDTDETVPGNISPEETAEFLAVKKAKAAEEKYPYDDIIAADTVVILDNEIMGKPRDINHARQMLRKLSGRTHKVITGVCVCSRGRSVSFSETTEVTFYELTDSEIENYVQSGDPMDKAGAYGIQSAGALLVKGIKGDYFNVVGLPVAKLHRVLEKMAVITGSWN